MPTQQTDIALADDYDVLIVNGDFAMVESTEQHQVQLLLNDKGDFKENPTIGVGIMNYIDDETVNSLAAEITRQFAADGMEVSSISIDNEKLKTDAYYP